VSDDRDRCATAPATAATPTGPVAPCAAPARAESVARRGRYPRAARASAAALAACASITSVAHRDGRGDEREGACAHADTDAAAAARAPAPAGAAAPPTAARWRAGEGRGRPTSASALAGYPVAPVGTARAGQRGVVEFFARRLARAYSRAVDAARAIGALACETLVSRVAAVRGGPRVGCACARSPSRTEQALIAATAAAAR
jgi:hypothetical protein